MPKKSRQKFKYLENEKSLKAFFIIFKGLSLKQIKLFFLKGESSTLIKCRVLILTNSPYRHIQMDFQYFKTPQSGEHASRNVFEELTSVHINEIQFFFLFSNLMLPQRQRKGMPSLNRKPSISGVLHRRQIIATLLHQLSNLYYVVLGSDHSSSLRNYSLLII